MSIKIANYTINFEQKGRFDFSYAYNSTTNFYDLLESLAYLSPFGLKICFCYEIQKIEYYKEYSFYNEKKKSKYINLDKNELIKNYRNEELIIIPSKECQCGYNRYLQKSKIDLIDILNNYKKEKEQLKSDNQLKGKELNNYKTNLNETIKGKMKCEEEIQQIKYKKEKLENKNVLATKEINDLKSKIEKENRENRLNNEKIQELTAKNAQLMEKKIENEKSNKETNFMDFYDVIVDIKSIKDICNGWQIKMNENAKANYENFKKEKVLKIGVIGNANKGKSFLLSKISKITLPSGTSIRTEGLSIKYPDTEEYGNRNIVLLDSAGLETPVLIDETETNKESKEQGINISENKEMEKVFREKSREKLITELFLQNYIIINSDIIIIVVGILTYSEQKLLTKIKNQIFNLKNRTKINKPKSLFIIHNLMSYKTRAQVEEYIEDFLLKSATFTLEKGHNISTQKGKNTTEYYYYEKSDDQQIFHLIFADDFSDAGDYYNKSTLNFIEKHFQNITSLTNYDVIETLKDCFVDLSKDILEKTENTEKPLTKENFDNSEERIKLNIANIITLKKCLIDELGISSLRANGFEPTYNYYKKDNSIILRIEIPGNFTIKSGLFNKGEFNIIQITGNKKKDKEPADEKDIIDNKREYGDFSFNIALEAAKYPLKRKQPKQDSKKGIIILEYELDDEMNEATFEEQEDV